MDISAILTEFGNYYLGPSAEANRSRVIKLLNRPSLTAAEFEAFPTDATVWRASKATIGRVLQPFQKGWTPIDGLTFTPLSIESFKLKIDAEEYPDDLEASWLGFLIDNDLDRREWPFIRWYVEEMLIPQSQEDLEMNEVYAGEYAAPTAGTPGAAGTAMNGIRKIINDAITAGSCTPIATGALSTDPATFLDQMESFGDAIDKRYWRMPMKVNMSESQARIYRRGYRAKYGKDTDFEGESSMVKDTNLIVNGLPSMDGAGKIWCTPRGNAKRIMKRTQNANAMRLETQKRQVQLFTDYTMGVGYVLGELIFTNDQDLV